MQAVLLASDASRAAAVQDFEQSVALYGQAHELFARQGWPNEAARALWYRGMYILVLGRLDEGKAAMEWAFAYAHDCTTVKPPICRGQHPQVPSATSSSMNTTSNLNFTADQTIANLVVVPVGADGNVIVYNKAGSVHVIADVAGWYTGP